MLISCRQAVALFVHQDLFDNFKIFGIVMKQVVNSMLERGKSP
jgi:hypothetical protein